MLRALVIIACLVASTEAGPPQECNDLAFVVLDDNGCKCVLTYKFPACCGTLDCPCETECVTFMEHDLFGDSYNKKVTVQSNTVCAMTCQVDEQCGCADAHVKCIANNVFLAASDRKGDVLHHDHVVNTQTPEQGHGRGVCVHTCRTMLNGYDGENCDCGPGGDHLHLICVPWGDRDWYFNHDAYTMNKKGGVADKLLDNDKLKLQDTSTTPPSSSGYGVKHVIPYDGICVPPHHPPPVEQEPKQKFFQPSP